MKASQLSLSRDYPFFPELIDYEIPLECIDSRVITTLQSVRYVLQQPIYPSPNIQGWVRLDPKQSTSRHYAGNRLSDAGDIFPEKGYCVECWIRMQQMKQVGGFGLYLDTRGIDGTYWPMLHFDLRPGTRIFWIRKNKKYLYMHYNSLKFWQLLSELIKQDMEFRNV
jgi:hypothetical protein